MAVEERIRELEAALRACAESLRLVEAEYLKGDCFAEWSHPAVSLRMADEVLRDTAAEKRQ